MKFIFKILGFFITLFLGAFLAVCLNTLAQNGYFPEGVNNTIIDIVGKITSFANSIATLIKDLLPIAW